MLDTKALKHAMLDADCSAKELAKTCKISKSALYQRFSGKVCFTLGEILLARERLHLTSEQYIAIFFAPQVS